MDISPRPEEKKQQKKGLRFSEGVVERATDKENVDSLANAFGAASFGGAKLVSPGTYLRKHPVRYEDPPLTPGTALLREPKAPASRWTPSARDSGASLGDDDDDDDDDDGEDDKEEGGDAASSVAASPVDDGKLCRESFGMFHRQQAAIDAAAEHPRTSIKILRAPADETTPAPPRYVTSYAEGRLSAESRASEWTPRRSDDEDDSDESEYEADEGMALSP